MSAVLSDLALARRLESAEGVAGSRFVEARARYQPDSGAQWIQVAGAYAMYDGVESPCTQTFALGMFEPPTAAALDELERFFTSHGAPVFHEVSPLAGKDTIALLNDRGYRPLEFTTVLFLDLGDARDIPPARSPELHSRVISSGEHDIWAHTAAGGWCESTEVRGQVYDLMRVMSAADAAVPFIAEWNSEPVATGALWIHEGVALFAGASTIPEWRNRGAQRALLESRLEYAKRSGCDLAMICTEPGSASQRNAERQGFRIAYTRLKWKRITG